MNKDIRQAVVCGMVARSGPVARAIARNIGAAVDVAALQVAVRAREIGSAQLVACENAIAKSRRETFDLRFDALRHIGLSEPNGTWQYAHKVC